MTMFVFWTTVTMLALLFGAGIAAMFCYGLFFKFVGVAVLGGGVSSGVIVSALISSIISMDGAGVGFGVASGATASAYA